MPLHLTVAKLEQAALVHHLPPTAAAVLGWKLLGMLVRDPAASGGNGCPALDGQLRGGLAQRANDAELDGEILPLPTYGSKTQN